MALLRASVTNPAAADRMREIFATQVLGLALTRYVLRLPPVTAMDRDTLVDWLAPTLRRYFTGEPG